MNDVVLMGIFVFGFLMKFLSVELFFLFKGVFSEIGFWVMWCSLEIFLGVSFSFLVIFLMVGLWFSFWISVCWVWVSLLMVLIMCIGIWIVFV